jgi:hypothetical protein
LNAALKSRLESLRADYASVKGAPFEYFFCPFLFRDENVRLCEGHVLNEALGVGKSIWTVQRKDVDSFFGSRFEADLTKLRYRGALGAHDVLSDGSLRRKLRPRIFAGDREIDFFIPQGAMPDGFTTVHSTENSLPPVIGLKIHQSELEEALDADWRIEVALDLRVGSFVSLLKAAHLTQFALFGYRYVLSPAGHLVGHQLLGRLFQECETASIKDAQQYAMKELASCINMVRPLLETELNLRGTVLDRQILVAWSASGFPWATIIIVPAGDTLHGVMLPVGDHVEGIGTWHDFMNNDNESIAIKLGRFDPGVEGGLWQLSKQSWRIQWPKGGSFADAAPEP